MPLNLSRLLVDGAVFPRIHCGSRRQVVQRLCEGLATALPDAGLDPAEVVRKVNEREKLGSTGVGEGVAIPHARLAGLSQPAGALATLADGIDYDAVDDEPCDIFFLLLAPEDGGADHLRALAQVSRALRQAPVRDALRAAFTEDDIRAALLSRPESSAA